MLGMQYILPALDRCGLNDLGYKLLTATGYPSYRSWVEDGATTLHEVFGNTQSCNHHMYSCFMAWMMQTIIGIRKVEPAYDAVVLAPCFFDGLDWARGHIDTPHGKISVDWKKEVDGKHVSFVIPDGITAQFGDRTLTVGEHSFVI